MSKFFRLSTNDMVTSIRNCQGVAKASKDRSSGSGPTICTSKISTHIPSTLSLSPDTCCPLTHHLRIFKTGSKFDKYKVFYDNPAQEGSFTNEPRREVALPRRALLAANFTRESVRRAEPRLTHHLSKFLDNLGHYARSNEPVNLTKACLCLSNDEVMEYIYQKPFGALDAEAFDSEVLGPVFDHVSLLQWPANFPRSFKAFFLVIDKLPEWILKRGLKAISTTKMCLQVSQCRVICSPYNVQSKTLPCISMATLLPS